MKSLKELWLAVSQELGTVCGVSTTRDFKTVTSRFEHEGLSFLTITLPDFGKAFEKGLDLGRIDHDAFPGFNRMRGLPRFLGGFLDLVFDRNTGRLLDDPNVDAIFAVRQLTLMFGKISVPCSDARNKSAIDKFIECEQDVRRFDRTLDPELLREFKSMALRVFGDVLASADLAVFEGTLTPKHGPGKTADRLVGNGKYDQSEWTERLERVFPYGENAIPNWRYYYLLDAIDILEPGRERPVKITLVPKTLKTPRIIAQEPTCMQYMQQAVAEHLTREIAKDGFLNDLVGFKDQTLNQRMALEGSISGSLATLDLSEASDRVSNQHVRAFTSCFPHLSEALDATRSRKADVPGRGVIRLAKFASMGSALCFPIEAMVFMTIVLVGIQSAHRRQLSKQELLSLRGRVRVFGDDILIPTEYVSPVIAHLEAFGLKVNGNKSFWTGKFRESCGKEYYAGTDVSITRVRHLLPSSLEEVEEVIAVVSLRNRLYEAGHWKTAFWLDRGINRLLGGRYPYVGPDSPLLGRMSFAGYDTGRLHPEMQYPQAKGYVVSPKPRASEASGEGILTKWFLKRGDKPFADRDHLLFAGRPEALRLNLRWARSA